MELKLGRIGCCLKVKDMTLEELEKSISSAKDSVINYAMNSKTLTITAADITCIGKGGKLYFYYDPEE